MRLTLAIACLCGLFLGGCATFGTIGTVPPQQVTRDNPEPRTILLSQMAAKLGWKVQEGVGAKGYILHSPYGDRVRFDVGSDIMVMNETYWRFERDAVQKNGFEVLLPESVFVFVARHFGRHDLVRDLDTVRRKSGYDLEPMEPKVSPASPKGNVIKGTALAGWSICIDAGHGGKDPGGMGFGVRESDVALAVSLMLRDLCLAQGAKVVMTRTTDVYPELDERCEMANAARCDFFISVHANNAPNDTSVVGFESFYNGDSAESRKLASVITQAVGRETDLHIRGAKKDPRGLRVLNKTRMPATLIELGFLSNKDEAARLATRSHQENLAKAVFAGILDYTRAGKATVSR